LEKSLLSSNILSTCPHNMVNLSPLKAEIDSGVWSTPANFNAFCVLPSLLQTTSLTGGQRNFALCLAVSYAGTLHIHFGGSCPLTEFCHVQNLFCVQVLRFPILAALLHGTSAAGINQTVRHSTRNGITELSQRAPPIFHWAAITFGIGPHAPHSSSYSIVFLWPPCVSDADVIFCRCDFCLLLSSHGRPME